jgi:hypothetical protein
MKRAQSFSINFLRRLRRGYGGKEGQKEIKQEEGEGEIGGRRRGNKKEKEI